MNRYYSLEEGGGIPTLRALEVAALIGCGYNNHRIALELGISHHTVKNHVANLMRLLDVNSRTEIVLMLVAQNCLLLTPCQDGYDVDVNPKAVSLIQKLGPYRKLLRLDQVSQVLNRNESAQHRSWNAQIRQERSMG